MKDKHSTSYDVDIFIW